MQIKKGNQLTETFVFDAHIKKKPGGKLPNFCL